MVNSRWRIKARLLERAVENLHENWFPAQEFHHERICRRYQQGFYQQDLLELREDLKRDFSLYLHVVQRLSQVDQASFQMTPEEVIELADEETLKKVLFKPGKQLFSRSMNNASAFQIDFLRELVLSTTTAEIFAGRLGYGAELGYLTTLLRQLGTLFVCWNYQSIFERAAESMTAEQTLEGSIERQLGFNPRQLGVSFAKELRLPLSVSYAVSDRIFRPMVGKKGEFVDQSREFSSKEKSDGHSLACVAALGEALARATNPALYPSALEDWKEARAAIELQLGPSGVEVIFELARENLQTYVESNTRFAELSNWPPSQEMIGSLSSLRELVRSNQSLVSCAEDLKAEILRLYSEFPKGEGAEDKVRRVIEEILPKAGFESGCIFTIDSTTQTLRPALSIGRPSEELVKKIDLSSRIERESLVASAYSCRSPLREEELFENGTLRSSIAGTIGNRSPVGVLYLNRIDRERSNQFDENDSMAVFQVIRQCLEDCLGLE